MLDQLKHAKVCDFGLSRGFTAKVDSHSLGFQSHSLTSEHVGTLRYLAPEAMRGLSASSPQAAKFKYDERCDVYSFALLLWELAHRCTRGYKRAAIVVGACSPAHPGALAHPPGSSPLHHISALSDHTARPSSLRRAPRL